MNSIIETCPSSKHLLTRIKEGACHTSRPAAGLALGGVWQKDADALSKSSKHLKASTRHSSAGAVFEFSNPLQQKQRHVSDRSKTFGTQNSPWRHGAMAPATQMRLLRLLGHGRNSSSCCLSSRQDLRSAATSRNVLNVYNICIIQNRSYIKDQIPQLAWPSALTSIRVRLPAPQKGNYNLLHSDCGSKNLSLPRCPEEHQCHVVRLGPWQCAESLRPDTLCPCVFAI